jgi:hypothetical protein
LKSLEDIGTTDTLLANSFFVAGGVTLAVGGGLILWQGFSSHEQAPTTVSLSPTALVGGAGLAVRVEVP